MDLRIGFGLDRHPFRQGRKLFLAGVEIPSEYGLDGHSDADVVCHAVIDALLGATNFGDIGEHFPESSTAPGASSIEMLRKVAKLVKEAGWKIVNIDTTVVCGKLRLALFRQKMIESLASAMFIEVQQVSVKFKSGNKLGFESEDGISCYAVCLLSRQASRG